MVGGRDYLDNQFNRATSAQRAARFGFQTVRLRDRYQFRV